MTDLVLLAADQQLPEDVGKAGPIGALLTVLLFIAILLLVKSMTTHLKRVPRSFDHGDDGPQFVVPAMLKTRNGSRARTPRARVLEPSKEPAQATCRKVGYPPTSTTSRGSAGRNVGRPCSSYAGARTTISRSAAPRTGTGSPEP